MVVTFLVVTVTLQLSFFFSTTACTTAFPFFIPLIVQLPFFFFIILTTFFPFVTFQTTFPALFFNLSTLLFPTSTLAVFVKLTFPAALAYVHTLYALPKTKAIVITNETYFFTFVFIFSFSLFLLFLYIVTYSHFICNTYVILTSFVSISSACYIH